MKAITLALILMSITPLFALATITAQKETSRMKKIKEYISKSITDPIITQQECPIPGLLHFTAFAEANLAEDPLIEDNFFMDEKGKMYDGFDFNMINYLPQQEDERKQIASWILQINRYVRIKDTTYKQLDNDSFEVRFTADYFAMHPFFRNPPQEDLLFIVSCHNGRWQLKDPKVLRLE